LLLHPIQQPQTPLNPLRQCSLRNDLMFARAKNVVPCFGYSLDRSAGPARHDYIFILQKMYIHIYNLYSILKTS
jgi:hypothetical protein